MKIPRIGHGYDVHRLTEGRKLILGGVDIPYEKGLLGHSDADVLAHAISDALLGAAALGDIGHLFPDNDDRFLGADSMLLLREVCRVVREAGYEIGNIDATVICERPKVGPRVAEIRYRLAELLWPDDPESGVARVSVKGKTNERMDAVGAGLGIEVHAVCLLKSL